MVAFFIRRVLLMIGTFFVLTYVIFFLTTQQGVSDLHHLTPVTLVPADYLIWLVRILHGDFGYSIYAGTSVGQAITSALPVTLMLVIPAFILQKALSIALGLLAGSRYHSIFDRTFTGVTFILGSIPQFLLALVAIFYLSVQLNWLPFNGLNTFALGKAEYGSSQYWAYFHAHLVQALADIASHLILPVLLLAIVGLVTDSQLVRVSLVEVLSEDYIRAARARGIKRRVIIWKHALRNAILPLITSLGTQIPALVFTAAIIENIFTLPGMGAFFVRAVNSTPPLTSLSMAPPPHDYNVISAYFVLLGIVAIAATLLTDVFYAIADPRVRAGGQTTTLAAPSPLMGGRRIAQIGKVRVTTGNVGLAALVAGAGLLGGLSVQHLLAPKPSIAGTWIATATSPLNPSNAVLLLLTLAEHSQGPLAPSTVTGTAQTCPSSVFGQESYAVTGDVDNSTVDLRMTSTNDIYEVVGPTGSLKSTLFLDGSNAPTNQLGFGAFGRLAPVSLSLQRGTANQFNALCAQPQT